MNSFATYLVIATVILLGGCKLTIISHEGGSVASQSGLNNCPQSTICPIDIDSPIFTETFVAQPEPGYEFVRWQGGEGFWCGGSVNPTCSITLAGSYLDVLAIETFKVLYAMPVYEHVGIDTDGDGVRNELDEDDDNDGLLDGDDPCPLDADPLCGAGNPIIDTVLVDGREWARPGLFSVSWDEINAVCHELTCDGAINGWNLSGWRWASVDDLNQLFNFYVEPYGLSIGPGPSEVRTDGTSAFTDFVNGGWSGFINGWTSTQLSAGSAQTGVAITNGIISEGFYTGISLPNDLSLEAWFFRDIP